MQELRSDLFLSAHPVVQAAYAHYCLVVIHPFSDGNGRVARAIASAFTYRAISMPIVVLSEQKQLYLDSLEQAVRGDYQAFVDFMMARSLETIQMVTESLQLGATPNLESSFAKFESLYRTVGGYTQDEVDYAGSRLQEELVQQFDKIFDLRRGPKLTLAINTWTGATLPNPEAGYRYQASGPRISLLNLTSAPPAASHISQGFHVIVPWNADGTDDVKAVFMDRDYTFAAQISDLMLQPSAVVKIRAEMFATWVVAALLAELTASAERTLRGQSS